MSLPQDSNFEACYQCHLSISANEILKCQECEAVFHRECVQLLENAEQFACESSTKRKSSSSKPKSVRSSKSCSASSKSSSKSIKLQLQLKILEEKQKLVDEQCRERELQLRERELQLKEKHKLQNEIMNSKINLLKESFEELDDD